MNIRTAPPMDLDAFETWIEGRQDRHELVRGVPVVLPYATRNHAKIVTALSASLVHALDPDAWTITTVDFGVRTGDRTIRFPDVLVEPAGAPVDGRRSVDPVFVAEILSPSTMHIDFHDKLDEYRALPSLRDYLILAQDEPRAWLWSRKADDAWQDAPVSVEGLEGVVRIDGLGVEIAMSAAYRGVSPAR